MLAVICSFLQIIRITEIGQYLDDLLESESTLFSDSTHKEVLVANTVSSEQQEANACSAAVPASTPAHLRNHQASLVLRNVKFLKPRELPVGKESEPAQSGAYWK